MQTIEEKNNILRGLSDDDLLETFFNPCDDDSCESYELIKAEIIRRLKLANGK